MRSLKSELLAKETKRHIENLKYIDRQVTLHTNLDRLGKEWVSGGIKRKYELDRLFPLYLKLELGVGDDLCVHGMLFVEHMEEVLGEELTKSESVWGSTLYCLDSEHFSIMFKRGKSTACRIEKTKVKKRRVEETEKNCH
jgi:hypothetical protein